MKFAGIALAALVLLSHAAGFAATVTDHQQVAYLKQVVPFTAAFDEGGECGDSNDDGICDNNGSND